MARGGSGGQNKGPDWYDGTVCARTVEVGAKWPATFHIFVLEIEVYILYGNEERKECVGVTAFEGTRHHPPMHTAINAPSEVKFMAARLSAHLMQCPAKAPTGWDCHETPFRCWLERVERVGHSASAGFPGECEACNLRFKPCDSFGNSMNYFHRSHSSAA